MKTVDIKTYSFSLHLSMGDDLKKIVQYINRKVKKSNAKLGEESITHIKETSNDRALAFYLSLDIYGHGLIWFNLKYVDQIDVISLSHEVIHACVDIFNHIGCEVNGETEEPFCYLHDFLMRECLGEIDKVRNENNIKASQPARVVQKLDKGNESSVGESSK